MAENSRDACRDGQGGLGSFLRSLLSGIPWSERAENEETVTIPRPETGAIKIDNANGRTRVVGEDRDDIEVHLSKVARAESEEQARALLEGIGLLTREEGDHQLIDFDVPRSWNRRGRVDVELRVPRDLKVSVVAANGRICVSGLRAAVRARSSNGAVRVENVTGDIDIATSNAKVSSACTCGKLVARSSNGKIELEDHCGSIDASTSNGLIRASMEGMGEEGVQLATSNGRIVLELPEKVDAEVDIRVDNGVIRNDRKLCKAARERSGQLRGRLGEGGAPIKLRTSNGSISLR